MNSFFINKQKIKLVICGAGLGEITQPYIDRSSERQSGRRPTSYVRRATAERAIYNRTILAALPIGLDRR